MPFLLAVHLVHGVRIGRQSGDGETVRPGHALLLAELHQTEDGLVAVVLRGKQRRVKGQIVGRTVADQGLSVPVRDDAPGGLHLFPANDGTNGLIGVILVVNHLNVIKNEEIDNQRQHQERSQKVKPRILHFFAIHRLPFFGIQNIVKNISIEHRSVPQQERKGGHGSMEL